VRREGTVAGLVSRGLHTPTQPLGYDDVGCPYALLVRCRLLRSHATGAFGRSITVSSARWNARTAIYELSPMAGVGPRIEQAAVGLIPGFPCSAPCEDVKLREPWRGLAVRGGEQL